MPTETELVKGIATPGRYDVTVDSEGEARCLLQQAMPNAVELPPANRHTLRKETKIMSNVEEIKAAIEALPEADYVRLREWFTEKDWEKWDRQIEGDSKSGKLDFLIAEAFEEKKKGILKEL